MNLKASVGKASVNSEKLKENEGSNTKSKKNWALVE
jgi:hypothetical protein